VVEASKAHQRPVGVCGAMASDLFGAILLLGLGLRDLSMEASAIGEVKAALGRVTVVEVEDAARGALEMSSAYEIEQALEQRFAARFEDLLIPDD
jgi:phosphoenolpyruvate-protein kinase (PTS system EI component)